MEGNEGAGNGEKYTKEQLEKFKTLLLARDKKAFTNEDGTEKPRNESIEIVRRILLDDYGVPSAEVNKWLNQSIERADPERLFDVAANIVKSAETKKNVPAKPEKKEVSLSSVPDAEPIPKKPVPEVTPTTLLNPEGNSAHEQRFESGPERKIEVTVTETEHDEAPATVEVPDDLSKLKPDTFTEIYKNNPEFLLTAIENRVASLTRLIETKSRGVTKREWERLKKTGTFGKFELYEHYRERNEQMANDVVANSANGTFSDYGPLVMRTHHREWVAFFTYADEVYEKIDALDEVESGAKKTTKKAEQAIPAAVEVPPSVTEKPAEEQPLDTTMVDERLTALEKSWEAGKLAVEPIAGNDNENIERVETTSPEDKTVQTSVEGTGVAFMMPDTVPTKADGTPLTPEEIAAAEKATLEGGYGAVFEGTGGAIPGFGASEGVPLTMPDAVPVRADGTPLTQEEIDVANKALLEQGYTAKQEGVLSGAVDTVKLVSPEERERRLVAELLENGYGGQVGAAFMNAPENAAAGVTRSPELVSAQEAWKAAREKNDGLETHYHAKLEDYYRTLDAQKLFSKDGLNKIGYGVQRLFGIDPKLTPELEALKTELYGAQNEYKAAGRNLAIEKYKDDPARGAQVLNRYKNLLAEKLVVGTIEKRNAVQSETIKTLHPNGTLIENTQELMRKSRGARIAAGILGYGAIGGVTAFMAAPAAAALSATAIGFGTTAGIRALRVGLGFAGGAAAGMGTSFVLDKTLVQGARENVGETEDDIKSSFFGDDAGAQGAAYEKSLTRLKDAERTKKIVSGVAAGLAGFGAAGLDLDGEKAPPVEVKPEPMLYTVQPGDNAWNIMEGEGKNPDVHSKVLFDEIPAGSRNIALDALFDYMETDKEFAASVGMESEWPHRIYEGEELNLTLLDEKLREIAVEKGLIGGADVLAETSTVPPEATPIEPVSYMASETTTGDIEMMGSPELIPETTVSESVAFAFRDETIIQMIDTFQHAKDGDADALASLEAAGVTIDQMQQAINWVFEQGEGGHIEDRLTLAEYIGRYVGEGGGAIEGPESEGPASESSATDVGTEAAVEAARTALIDSVEHPNAGLFSFFGGRDFSGAFEKMDELSFKEIIAIQGLTEAERGAEFAKLGVTEDQWEAWVKAANEFNKTTPVTDTNETLGGYIERLARGRAEAS